MAVAGTGAWAPRPLLAALLLAAAGLAAGPGASAAQTGPRPGFSVAAEGAVSLRDLGGIRIAEDVLTYTLRLTRTRPRSVDLWVDGGRFLRPDFECVAGFPCSDEGWIVRAGIDAVGGDPTAAGPRAGVRGGLGATLADETRLTYLVGLALRWPLPEPLDPAAPFLEFRWEHVAGINLTMLAAGLAIAF